MSTEQTSTNKDGRETGLSGAAGSGLLPCPFCGAIPTAKTEGYGFSMWDEWSGGKPVHQGAQNFCTKFSCTDGCLMNGILGPSLHASLDYRDTRTKADIHDAACRKWNSRPNNPVRHEGAKPRSCL